jgi:hypothetical protein
LISTEYGRYDICWGETWSISTTTSGCKNILIEYSPYINGAYRNCGTLYSSTYSAYNGGTWSSTLMYYRTSRKYTYKLLAASGLIYLNSYYSNTYTFSSIKTNTMTSINSLTYYTTDVRYSTITKILYSSSSQFPNDEFTCNVQSCNDIELFILLYTLLHKCN